MNRKTTLALVAVFGVLILYVIFIQRPKEEAAKNATPTPGPGGTVWTLTSDQVTGFRIANAAGQAVALTKDAQGAWAVTEPEAKPADDGKVANAVTQLIGLSYSEAITSVADVSVFGVLNPTFTLDVTLSDGTHKKAAIGDKAPVGSSYYLQREGESMVLVANSFGIDTLTAIIATPPYFVPTPSGTPTAGFVLPAPRPKFSFGVARRWRSKLPAPGFYVLPAPLGAKLLQNQSSCCFLRIFRLFS